MTHDRSGHLKCSKHVGYGRRKSGETLRRRHDLAVQACLAGKLDRVDAELARYLAAARSQMAALERDARPQQRRLASEGFEMAQSVWTRYRDAACGAVFEAWSGGTIRVAMEQTCRIRLTEHRTHELWRDWLTYVDSTPPILVEPRVEPEP